MPNLNRTILTSLAAPLAWKHLVRYRMLLRLAGPQRAISDASEHVARIPGLLGVRVRQQFFRHVLGRVGCDVHFGFMSCFSKQAATVGEHVYIGRFCTIGLAELGDDVMLADGVQVLSGRHTHGRTAPATGTLRDNPLQFQRITIARGAWIGAGAIIMADVGEAAIVGAASVVTRPVPAHTTVAGAPARPITRDATTRAA